MLFVHLQLDVGGFSQWSSLRSFSGLTRFSPHAGCSVSSMLALNASISGPTFACPPGRTPLAERSCFVCLCALRWVQSLRVTEVSRHYGISYVFLKTSFSEPRKYLRSPATYSLVSIYLHCFLSNKKMCFWFAHHWWGLSCYDTPCWDYLVKGSR